MILHVESVTVCGPYLLRLRFDDADERVVDVRPLLRGPVFEPLLDADFFARAELDPVCRTVVWPNGADLAPEALRSLPNVERLATA